jgi:NAD(P)-dependent dehydrogenase (short-subunit alcohol dehydrogenase family)
VLTVSMICPANVNLSTMAARSRGSVNVFVQEENCPLPIPWVEADDISNAVLFLASDESRYITGVTLPIDAGSCLK